MFVDGGPTDQQVVIRGDGWLNEFDVMGALDGWSSADPQVGIRGE